MLKAIETRYKGYRFRSRLEARWAVFFDTLGVPWEYEKEGFDLGEAGRYLPDFWLPNQKVWVEIKGQETEDSCNKADALYRASDNSVYVAIGPIGDHKWVSIGWEPLPLSIEYTKHFAGLITMIDPKEDDWLTDPPGIQLHCPICGFEYVHFSAPVYQETDRYDAWEGRGSAMRFPMWCESNHFWTLRFGFHKGGVSLAIESVAEGTDDLGLYLAAGDNKRYAAAISAARSARFEYGEHGR